MCVAPLHDDKRLQGAFASTSFAGHLNPPAKRIVAKGMGRMSYSFSRYGQLKHFK